MMLLIKTGKEFDTHLEVNTIILESSAENYGDDMALVDFN